MKKLSVLLFVILAGFGSRAQVLLTESFNVTSVTSTPPTGWTINSLSTNVSNGCNGTDISQVPSGGFICTNNGAPQPTPTAHSGSGMGGYNCWDIVSGSASEFVSPVLDFSASGTNTMNIWVYNQQAFYGSDSLMFLVNTSPTSVGGVLLDALIPNYNPPSVGWTQYQYQIPTSFTSTTNYIIIRAVSNYGYDVFFDDVDVTHNPPTPCTGTPAAPSISNTPYSAALPVCTGTSITLNGFDPNFPTIGGLTYQWQSSSSSTGPWANVTAGTGATTRTYNTGSLTSSTYFRMTTTCTASTLTSNSAAFLIPIGAAQPGTITGAPSFCPGDPLTYTVTAVSGSSYTWTLPTGWSGTSTTNAITVTPSLSSGTISVKATNSCGTSIAQTKAIILGSAPAVPGTITGNTYVCNASTQTYSVVPVTGAVSYTWTVPTGWSISGSAVGSSISTITSSSSGTISVMAINGCGSNTNSVSIIVVNSLANPGTITGNSTPCSNTLNSYSINPVPGATSYQWYLPSGWSGTTTGTSIQAFAGTTNGNLKVTAFSSCATSPTASLATTIIPSVLPSISLSPSMPSFCQGALITFTATPGNAGSTPSYTWKKNGTVIINTGTTYLDNKLTTGDVIEVMLQSNAICRMRDTASAQFILPAVTPSSTPGINVDEFPVADKCEGVNRIFTSNIVDGGAMPTYQWYNNNNLIAGATGSTYQSTTLANNDSLSVLLTSTAVCATSPSVLSNRFGVEVFPNVVPTVSASSSTTTVGNGEIIFTATATGGGTGATYQWLRNGVNIPFATGPTFSSSTLSPGDHISVKMLSYAPCALPASVQSNDIIMDNPLAIGSIGNWEGTISLYPNPNTGNFRIDAVSKLQPGQHISIVVMNMVGQRVYQTEIAPTASKWALDIRLNEALTNGRYMIQLNAGNMRAALPFVLAR